MGYALQPRFFDKVMGDLTLIMTNSIIKSFVSFYSVKIDHVVIRRRIVGNSAYSVIISTCDMDCFGYCLAYELV